MGNSKLPKKTAEKLSRSFSNLFNRAFMYKMDHPFTIQSIEELYETFTDALNSYSPIVITFNHDQFFIDEELFDHRLNNSRMITHFKKVGIQSISFERDMQKSELHDFAKIFTNQKSYSSAESMKIELTKKMVSNLKINHFIFRKVTADDEIVSKDKFKEISENSNNNPSTKIYSDVVGMLAKNILLDEVEKTITLETLLSDPEKLSKDIINKDLSHALNNQTESISPGIYIEHQIAKLREETDKNGIKTENLNLSELADAVFELKKKLIEGVESQKAMGIIYENEAQIIGEANTLTDKVVIELVKDEYKKGKTSIKRLAQILWRLIPDPNELKRLLPILSESMLKEGMPKSHFTQLMKLLSKELQNENLFDFLKLGSEKIGVESEDLIKEFKNDPSCVAELIYLASELRKGTGDKKALTNLLVDYVERLGSRIALENTNTGGQKDSSHLREVISNVQSEIVRKLKNKNIENDVIEAVHQKLTERMDLLFIDLKTEWERRQDNTLSIEDAGESTIFKLLEESVEDGGELHKILKQMRSSNKAKGIDENNIEQLLREIQTVRKIQEQEEQQKKSEIKKCLPNGILSHNNTLLFIEKEISRSLRYKTPFSALTFSIEKIIPKEPFLSGVINGRQINNFLMSEMISILRGADLVGILTKKILVVLLPMTENRNAKIALSRILKSLHAKSYIINKISLSVRFVGAVTSFDSELTPDLASFICAAENEHDDFLIRLRNVQDLY